MCSARGAQNRLIFALALGFACASCRARAKSEEPPERSAEPRAAANPTRAPEEPERYELLSHFENCDVEHEGLSVDFGTSALQARRRFSIAPVNEATAVDREGASFERIRSSSVWVDIWLEAPIQRPMLSLRVHGGSARFMQLSIDDVRFGALRMPVDETRIVATAPASSALARGRHRILLRFSGASRSNNNPLAEIDWLRLSEPTSEPAKYAAPTREDAISDVALDHVPKKSLVLRAPSSVRCWLRPAPDARLKVAVGLLGAGKGVAEVRLLRDGEAPIVLQTRKVSGGDVASWTPVAVDLGAYASSVVGIELATLEATRGGRVAFGDPVVVRHASEPIESPHARLAIVVVLAASDRKRLPPWGPTGELKVLGELARTSTVWSAHRAPSSVPAAVIASLLTGHPPSAHGLLDPSSRLVDEARLLSEVVKEASGRTAMFTGVPTSFAPFGFDQGFDVFDAVSPVKDLPAGEPLQRAQHWLEQALDDSGSAPIFAFVHARGAHPPWDVSREEAQHLKPAEYAGIVDPRRGGIVIGGLRGRRQRVRHLADEDWTRIHELGDASLAKQDAALGQLVAMLRRRGVWDDTLLVVTGDVAAGDPPDFPFDPKGALSEDRLLIPLLIKFPNALLGGKEIQAASAVEDLSVTLLKELGLRVPRDFVGSDLFERANGREPLEARAQIAVLGERYASRLGSWLLRGQNAAVPTLCAVDVDPACVSDVFEREIIAARALWQATFHDLSEAREHLPPEAQRRALTLDPETSAALVVWGDD